MWSKPQFPADLATFTEEILNGRLHFFCAMSLFDRVLNTPPLVLGKGYLLNSPFFNTLNDLFLLDCFTLKNMKR